MKKNRSTSFWYFRLNSFVPRCSIKPSFFKMESSSGLPYSSSESSSESSSKVPYSFSEPSSELPYSSSESSSRALYLSSRISYSPSPSRVLYSFSWLPYSSSESSSRVLYSSSRVLYSSSRVLYSPSRDRYSSSRVLYLNFTIPEPLLSFLYRGSSKEAKIVFLRKTPIKGISIEIPKQDISSFSCS